MNTPPQSQISMSLTDKQMDFVHFFSRSQDHANLTPMVFYGFRSAHPSPPLHKPFIASWLFMIDNLMKFVWNQSLIRMQTSGAESMPVKDLRLLKVYTSLNVAKISLLGKKVALLTDVDVPTSEPVSPEPSRMNVLTPFRSPK